MITEKPRDEVIALGIRCRADHLLEQAGYTLKLVDAEGKPITNLLPDGFVPEVKSKVDTVTTALGDKALQIEVAKSATGTHHTAFADAKIWRRTVARRASCASRIGKAIPEGLLRVSQVRTPAALAVQTHEMLELLQANRAAIPGAGIDKLIAQGKALAATLHSVDADKELKRQNDLPKSVQEFHYEKGLLYLGLKAINDAGQALYANDAVASSRFNLNLLNRRSGPHTPPDDPNPPSGPKPGSAGA